MKAGDGERASRLNLAGDICVVDGASGFQRDQSSLRIVFVAVLDRSLHRSQLGSVHVAIPYLGFS